MTKLTMANAVHTIMQIFNDMKVRSNKPVSATNAHNPAKKQKSTRNWVLREGLGVIGGA